MTTTELLPREALAQVLHATQTKGIDMTMSVALANAAVDGLERLGLIIADVGDVIEPPDEHLRTLKTIRKTIRSAIESDPSDRDLASLSRRLQDVSKEVTVLEERHRTENKERGTSNNGSNAGRSTAPSSGPLNL